MNDDPLELLNDKIIECNTLIADKNTLNAIREQTTQKRDVLLQISQTYRQAKAASIYGDRSYTDSCLHEITKRFATLESLHHDQYSDIRNAMLLPQAGQENTLQPYTHAHVQGILNKLNLEGAVHKNSLQKAQEKFDKIPPYYGQKNYKQELEAWTNDINRYLQNLPGAKKAVEKYCQARQRLTHEALITALEKQLKNINEKISENTKEIDKLNQTIATHQSTILENNKKIEANNKTIGEMEALTRNRQLEIASETAEKQIKDLTQTKQGLVQAQSQLEKQRTPLEKIKQLQTDKEKILADHGEKRYQSIKEVKEAYEKAEGELAKLEKKHNEIGEQFKTLQNVTLDTQFHELQAQYQVLHEEAKKRLLIQTIEKLYEQVRIHEYIAGEEWNIGAKSAEQSEFSRQALKKLQQDGTLSTAKSLDALTKHYNETLGTDARIVQQAKGRRDSEIAGSTAITFEDDGSINTKNEGALLRALQLAIATGNRNLIKHLEEPVKKVLAKKIFSKEWRNTHLRSFMQKIDSINVQWDMNIAMQQFIIALFMLFGPNPFFSFARYYLGDRRKVENLYKLVEKIKSLDLNNPTELLQAYDIIKDDKGFKEWINDLTPENFRALADQLRGRDEEGAEAALRLFSHLTPDHQKEVVKHLDDDLIRALYNNAEAIKKQYREQFVSEILNDDKLTTLFNHLPSDIEGNGENPQETKSTLLENLSLKRYFTLFQYSFDKGDIQTTADLLKYATEAQRMHVYKSRNRPIIYPGLSQIELDNVKIDKLVKIYKALSTSEADADVAKEAAFNQAMQFFVHLPETVQNKIRESWKNEDYQKAIDYLTAHPEESYHQAAYQLYKSLPLLDNVIILGNLKSDAIVSLLQQAVKEMPDSGTAQSIYLLLNLLNDDLRERVTNQLDVKTAAKLLNSLLEKQDLPLNACATLFTEVHPSYRAELVKNVLANLSGLSGDNKIQALFEALCDKKQYDAAKTLWLNLPNSTVLPLNLIQALNTESLQSFAKYLFTHLSDEKNLAAMRRLYGQSTKLQQKILVGEFGQVVENEVNNQGAIKVFLNMPHDEKRFIFEQVSERAQQILAIALIKSYAEEESYHQAAYQLYKGLTDASRKQLLSNLNPEEDRIIVSLLQQAVKENQATSVFQEIVNFLQRQRVVQILQNDLNTAMQIFKTFINNDQFEHAANFYLMLDDALPRNLSDFLTDADDKILKFYNEISKVALNVERGFSIVSAFCLKLSQEKLSHLLVLLPVENISNLLIGVKNFPLQFATIYLAVPQDKQNTLLTTNENNLRLTQDDLCILAQGLYLKKGPKEVANLYVQLFKNNAKEEIFNAILESLDDCFPKSNQSIDYMKTLIETYKALPTDNNIHEHFLSHLSDRILAKIYINNTTENRQYLHNNSDIKKLHNALSTYASSNPRDNDKKEQALTAFYKKLRNDQVYELYKTNRDVLNKLTSVQRVYIFIRTSNKDERTNLLTSILNKYNDEIKKLNQFQRCTESIRGTRSAELLNEFSKEMHTYRNILPSDFDAWKNSLKENKALNIDLSLLEGLNNIAQSHSEQNQDNEERIPLVSINPPANNQR